MRDKITVASKEQIQSRGFNTGWYPHHEQKSISMWNIIQNVGGLVKKKKKRPEVNTTCSGVDKFK